MKKLLETLYITTPESYLFERNAFSFIWYSSFFRTCNFPTVRRSLPLKW